MMSEKKTDSWKEAVGRRIKSAREQVKAEKKNGKPGCLTQEQLSEKLGVEEQVHFLGYRRDVPALLKNADVYAFPSLREGLGMASIEAMATGLPIVTSNRHGINDYSEDGVTGFKYDPDDYRGFAKGIRTIAYDDALKQRMGIHNREVSKQYTVDESMSRLGRVYATV